ncbi:unnamed protein product [Hapterophycus canaliculatus]
MMRNKAHQNDNTETDAKSYRGESAASGETKLSPKTGIAPHVLGGLTGGIAYHLSDAGSPVAMRKAGAGVPPSLSRRGDDLSVPPTAPEVQHSRSKAQLDDEEKYTALSSNHDDEDTAAGDGSTDTSGGGGRGGLEYGEGNATYSLQSGDHADGGNLPAITPRSNDTVSDLSCSDLFSGDSVHDDGRGETSQSIEDGSAHDSSSESPKQSRPATYRCDFDDLSVSHVAHLIQERRRWKLRALEAEHELLSMRSSYARKERGADEAAVAVPLLVDGAESDYVAGTTEASASFGHWLSSEFSAVGSGCEFDSRCSTTSDRRISTAASSCSTDGPCVVVGPSSLESLDTATKGQLSAPTSRTADHMPATAGRYEAEGTLFQRSATEISHDKNYNDGFCPDAAECQKDENGPAILRHPRKDFVVLKEELRKAELRYAAAEATAASVLQRARAAEISRDVKEIQQIRNLEIRLARHVHSDKLSQRDCDEQRKVHLLTADDLTRPECRVNYVRPHPRKPLPPVAEGEEGASPSPFEKKHQSSYNATQFSTSLPEGPDDAVFPAPSERESIGTIFANSRGRWAIFRSSRGCFNLGTRPVQAGGESMSVAPAAVNEAAEDIAGGRENRKTGQDPRSQAQINGGLTEEYWGSDYCTSV